MKIFRALSLPALGLLLSLSATAQTPTTHLPTHRVKRLPPPAPRTVSNTTPAARAADPLRGTNDSGKGNNVYAAPGQPVTVGDDGKNTPSYDGPATKPASPAPRTSTDAPFGSPSSRIGPA